MMMTFGTALLLAASAFAGSPMATLTSTEAFTLDGHSVAVAGVNSWPVVIGDTIATQGGSAVLVLQNGSKIQIWAHSTVQLAGSASDLKVVVVSGGISALSGTSTSAKASLTSLEAFTLDGHSVAGSGVNSWPVVIGDTITTQGAPAVLVLQDGSKIQLLANSTVELVGSASQPQGVSAGGSIAAVSSTSTPTRSGTLVPHAIAYGPVPSISGYN